MFMPFKKISNSILVCSVLAVGSCPTISKPPHYESDPFSMSGEGNERGTPPAPESESGGGSESIGPGDIQ